MAENGDSATYKWVKLAQPISVIVGVVISVLSFNDTRNKEAEAKIEAAKAQQLEMQKYADQKQAEAYKAQIEAAKPFLELRQKRYLEAAHAAGILAEPGLHTKQELADARKQFSELYYADLGLVEEDAVAVEMKNFSQAIGHPAGETPVQTSSLNLVHTLRDSLTKSWGVSKDKAGDVVPVNK